MTPETISAIFDGLQSLVIVAGGFYLQSLTRKVEAAKQQALTTDERVAKVAADASQTLALVNGPYGAALAELAVLQAWKASVTGTRADDALAGRAQLESERHAGHTAAIQATAQALTAATEAQTVATDAAIAAKVDVPKLVIPDQVT